MNVGVDESTLIAYGMTKSCVGIVASYEELNIVECMCFNYLLGFDKIIVYLYPHHSTPPDKTKECIESCPKYVLDKIIVIYNVEHDYTTPFQGQGYESILRTAIDCGCDWLAMFDVDECFYDKEHRKINSLLASVDDDVGQVLIPWLHFGGCNEVLSPKRPYCTRLNTFTLRHASYLLDYKPIVRLSNIINPDSPWWYKCHFAEVRGRNVNFNNQDVLHKDLFVTWDEDWSKISYHETCTEDQCLVHYYLGSMEDYVARAKRWDVHWQTKETYEHSFKIYSDYCMAATVLDERMLQYQQSLVAILSDVEQ